MTMCGTYCFLVLHYTCELLRRLLRGSPSSWCQCARPLVPDSCLANLSSKCKSHVSCTIRPLSTFPHCLPANLGVIRGSTSCEWLARNRKIDSHPRPGFCRWAHGLTSPSYYMPGLWFTGVLGTYSAYIAFTLPSHYVLMLSSLSKFVLYDERRLRCTHESNFDKIAMKIGLDKTGRTILRRFPKL